MANNQESDHVAIPAEKAYTLQKIEVLQEVQVDLLEWGKRRFWIISIVSLIIALLGGSTLILNLVQSQVENKVTQEISKYERKLDELNDATAISRASTKRASELTAVLEGQLLEFDRKTSSMRSKLEALSTSIETKSSNLKVRSDITEESLIKRIESIEKIALKKSDASETKIYLQAKTKAKEKEEIRKALFDANSKIEITLNHDSHNKDLAVSISDLLSKKGYSLNLRDWTFSEFKDDENKEQFYSRLPSHAEITGWPDIELIQNIIKEVNGLVELKYNNNNPVRFLSTAINDFKTKTFEKSVKIFLMEDE